MVLALQSGRGHMICVLVQDEGREGDGEARKGIVLRRRKKK
jgi:hypothetical protein